MKNILRVFISDMKRISTNVVAIVVVIGLTVIPSLYAWFNILSNWDPYGQEATSKLKVAVVSDDNGASIDGVEVNIGEKVIEALKTNDTIGWVFEDNSDDVIESVRSGEYYAALIMPEDFSSDMISFLSDTITHPQILYYCNQKKNAIAPKITDKAKTAVKEQVNETFISTIASSLVTAGDTVANSDKLKGLGTAESGSVIDIIKNKLKDASDELNTYNVLLTSLISITDLSTGLSDQSVNTAGQLNNVLEQQRIDVAVVQKMVEANKLSSLEELSGVLSENLSAVQNVMSSISSIYTDMNGSVNDFNSAVNDSNINLSETKDMLNSIQDKISSVIESLEEFSDSDNYGLMSDILDTDASTLGSFISSPVLIETEKIYEIAEYGSAASPFYTVLSIWVGGLIMVAIIHAHVKSVKIDGYKLKPYQKFFGRYITFFIIGQLQTLLIVLGNLFYLQIQCIHPFMMWFACSVTSTVFTFFMYSLTVAFGNIGEALAIVFMVVQVAGSGGTFPIEVLPKVYQMIYKYLPFPYAMDAVRETVAGMYGNYYWKCLGILCIYIVISLVIGLVLRIPFEKMNEMIEESKEKSGVML
jgi:YhgE/Pip-like protein